MMAVIKTEYRIFGIFDRNVIYINQEVYNISLKIRSNSAITFLSSYIENFKSKKYI